MTNISIRQGQNTKYYFHDKKVKFQGSSTHGDLIDMLSSIRYMLSSIYAIHLYAIQHTLDSLKRKI